MVAQAHPHSSIVRKNIETAVPVTRHFCRDSRGRFARRARVSSHEALVPARSLLFVVSEMGDFVKTGGLGEVAAALPRALRKNIDARVLIPGYPMVLDQVKTLDIVGRIERYAGLPECHIGKVILKDGLPVYVLLCAELYDRSGSPYVSSEGVEWKDNPRRFATLSHAAAEIAAGRVGIQWQPELLHLNDWHSALAASYVRWSGIATPTVLTIHNLAYQGLFPRDLAPQLGIPETAMDELDFYGKLSFLQGGILHSTHINTVSASYARQITQPAQGCGLDRLLAVRAGRGELTGILNGIDSSWDPQTDGHLDAHFAIGDWQGKQINAREVRRAFNLPEAGGPLFAVVSRLVHQKGVDLVCDVMPQIAAAGGQVVVIGGGEPQLEEAVALLSRRYPGHVGVYVGFEEGLARRMFAGSDFLLMPSRFEPCGLSQMYAQRFGSLPVAHATGGLIDTVDDGVTGFLFQGASADGLRRCLQRAFRVFRLPSLFNAMRRAAMLRPSGWDIAGREYRALYERALA